jgi:toxin-antitoxin system PIN domain toxin
LATLFDTNVWLALTFSSHPFHDQAKAVFDKATPKSPACFCRATQQSFLRLASTPVILAAYGATAFTNEDALHLLNSLTALPQIGFLDEPKAAEPLWYRFASLKTASPKVWMDAYLAAFAIKGGAEFVTLDKDFTKLEKHGLQLVLLP